MAKILLLNCGSSSIKYQLIDPSVGDPEVVGLVQRIGQDNATIDHTVGGVRHREVLPLPDHSVGVAKVVEAFETYGPPIDEVSAVGHRTVHGGKEFSAPTVITDAVVERMVQLIPLAPLHNPPGIAGIEGAKAALPDVPHVAVFDTAFFSQLPEEASTYAIDREVARELDIRKYGFHGTSHEYVARKAAEFVDRPLEELKIITAHIGNGASITAIDGGRPIDTSMGMSPLEGLVMGTRSGDVDPGLFSYLSRNGMSADDIDTMLNKRSGLQGLGGFSDMRDTLHAVADGDDDARLAFKVYCRRIVKYIGAYIALLGGADVLVFTAGVGENSIPTRTEVMHRLRGIGVTLDEVANDRRGDASYRISGDDSSITVLVVPTNEELAMAERTEAVLQMLEA